MFYFLWILWIMGCVSAVPCFEHLKLTPHLLGAYRPQCTPDGLYNNKQCHGSTGYCWCVTPQGHRRLDAVPPGTTINCHY